MQFLIRIFVDIRYFWLKHIKNILGSGPALTAHGSLDLKQEIQIQIQMHIISKSLQCQNVRFSSKTRMFSTLQLSCTNIDSQNGFGGKSGCLNTNIVTKILKTYI
jgi:hypothetical protein